MFAVWLFFASQVYGDFQTRVADEISARDSVGCPSAQCPTVEKVRSYQFIFVDGFLADHFGQNFKPITDVLKNQFGAEDTVLFRPDSKNTIEDNADKLLIEILDARRKSASPHALMIAHSKGAAESLLMVLEHPELIAAGIIDNLVVVDGAFNGTPLADLWGNGCQKRKSDGKISELCRSLLKFGDGLISLKPSQVIPVMNSALNQLSDEDRALVSPHIWSIESEYGSFLADGPSPLAIPHFYLNRFGPNDGVILTQDELLPSGFGKNLGVFKAGHNALLGNPHSKEIKMSREAFGRALIREMVHQD